MSNCKVEDPNLDSLSDGIKNIKLSSTIIKLLSLNLVIVSLILTRANILRALGDKTEALKCYDEAIKLRRWTLVRC